MTKKNLALAFAAAIAATLAGPLAYAPPALAQTVIGSVNDDPVTNIDVEQHLRILRVLKRSATTESALESIYEARLKLIETAKYKVTPGDQDIGWALSQTARAMKIEPQQLLVALQRAGVTEDQWKQKWKGDAAWLLFIRALNRTLELLSMHVTALCARAMSAIASRSSVLNVIEPGLSSHTSFVFG